MLPASNRLRKSEDFRRCLRAGNRCGGPLLVVHLLAQPADPAADLPSAPDPAPASTPDPGPRAGLVVSRAVGNAVTRNLVKRRLRHLLRDRLDQLPEHALVVLRAQPAAATATYQELGDELDRCLQRCLSKSGKVAGST